MLDVADLILNFILYRNVFPRGQEHAFVHLPVLREENVHWNDAAEVEHVDTVLHRHLCNDNHAATQLRLNVCCSMQQTNLLAM